MRTLRDLLATWENWSARDTLIRASAQAPTEHAGEVLRHSLAETEVVDPLDALRDASELVALLSGWQWQTVYAARLAGATWDEIGAAIGASADDARADYSAALDRQERYTALPVDNYRRII